MRKLIVDMTQHNTTMQNQIMQLERNQQPNQPKFPPKNFNKAPTQQHRLQSFLEPTNAVSEFPYYCKACRNFHDEQTCAFYMEYIKNNIPFEEDDLEVCNLFERK